MATSGKVNEEGKMMLALWMLDQQGAEEAEKGKKSTEDQRDKKYQILA